MVLKSDRLKKQNITKSRISRSLRKTSRFSEKLLSFTEESKLKIGIVLVCIIFFLAISFLYPNYSAWNSISSQPISNFSFSNLVDPAFSRTLITILSKQDDKRVISYLAIVVMDQNSKTYSIYSLDLNLKVNVNSNETTLRNIYDIDNQNYFSNISSTLNVTLENGIMTNEENLKTLGESYGVKDEYTDSEKYVSKLFQNVQSEWLPFFKQKSWAKIYSESFTNMNPDQFRDLTQNFRDYKIANQKVLTNLNFGSDDTHYFADKALTNEQLRVEISNATTQNGLGNMYAEKLKNIGVNISKISTFELKTTKNLIYVPDNLANSITLKSILMLVGDSEIIHTKPSEYSSADILVVVSK